MALAIGYPVDGDGDAPYRKDDIVVDADGIATVTVRVDNPVVRFDHGDGLAVGRVQLDAEQEEITLVVVVSTGGGGEGSALRLGDDHGVGLTGVEAEGAFGRMTYVVGHLVGVGTFAAVAVVASGGGELHGRVVDEDGGDAATRAIGGGEGITLVRGGDGGDGGGEVDEHGWLRMPVLLVVRSVSPQEVAHGVLALLPEGEGGGEGFAGGS